jgi:hypothetical protein
MQRAPGYGIEPVSVEETEVARFTVTADGKGLDRAFRATRGCIPPAHEGDTLVLVKRVAHYHGGGFTREWVLGGRDAGTRKRAMEWAAMIADPA